MKNKDRNPIVPEGLELLVYYIGKGLRKLVPCDEDIGWPAFDKYGNNRDYKLGLDKTYLLVKLTILPPVISSEKWVCCITLTDGDDFILQRWMDFDLENWKSQMDLYNEITYIDQHTLSYLDMEGFR